MIRKLLFFLNRKQKTGIAVLTFMTFIGALLETVGVSAIIPIVEMMASPESAGDSVYIRMIAALFHLTDSNQVFICMLWLMIAIYIVKNFYLLMLVYVQSRFINRNRARTQGKFLEWYLNRPYEFFLYADVAEILRTVRSDIQNVFAILLDLMHLMTEVSVSLCIGVFLFVTDWKMTMFLLVLVVVVTFGITRQLKNRIGRLGRKDQKHIAVLTRWILQSMNGIKIVKVLQKEPYFGSHHMEEAERQAKTNTRYAVYSAIPKLLLEVVFITGILVYLMLSMMSGRNMERLVTIIAAFAVAAFRVLPSVSRINNYMSNIAYYEPSLTTIYNLVQKEGYDRIFDSTAAPLAESKEEERLNLKGEIELEGVTFAYPNTDKKILDSASMKIPLGSSVGIKGPSGAGKTTVVDILLGLLDIQGGVIRCNGHNILEHKSQWLSHIGYIPQNVYLTDASIKMNVAFGVEENEIDEARVWEVLREAQLEEFVKGQPESIQTEVGEQGIRISGGQKQRLGIARALYHDPEILIFDEATSALDNNTETAIMEAIEQFKGKKTMIIIAHRLRTIEQCDIVYEVDNGKIVQTR